MTYRDRHDAGRQLAAELAMTGPADPVVLALPRGGVPVAYQVARVLQAPLDVLIVRKLGHPVQPEFAIGALGEGGVRFLDDVSIDEFDISTRELQDVTEIEQAELRRRSQRYRRGRDPVPIEGRNVILVDDGLATGSSARAAVEVARQRGAAQVVLAVPVAPESAVAQLRRVADTVLCMQTPRWFGSVGSYYDDFEQTTDEEVARLLDRAEAQRTDATLPISEVD